MLSKLGIAVLSAIAALLVLEVLHRGWFYYWLVNKYPAILAAKMDPALSELVTFDVHMGFSYKPDIVYSNDTPWRRAWRTNRHGMISNEDYPVEKPAGEFRIAVIGDSFTANVTSEVRWTDLLQARLNENPGWKERVGGKFTRVLNFGRDGIGIVQFDDVYEYDAARFGPDLVILNFISSDIERRPYFRGSMALDGAMEDVIRDHIESTYVPKLPWFRPSLDSLKVVFGPYTGTRPVFSVAEVESRLGDLSRFYATHEEAIAVSLETLRKVRAAHPSVLVLHQPEHWELANREYTSRGLQELRTKFFAAAAAENLHIVAMQAYMPEVEDKSVLRAWFNIPFDDHPSVLGNEIYAAAVEQALIDHLPGPAGTPSGH